MRVSFEEQPRLARLFHFVLFAAILAGAVTVSLAPPATAGQDAEIEGVLITPAKFEEDLGLRTARRDVSVVNVGDLPHTVRLTVHSLGHDLAGTANFGPLKKGSMVIEGATFVTLEPGETHTVVVESDFPDEVAHYGGLLATIDETNATVGDVGAVSSLASLFLLRGPGPWDQTLELRGVEVVASPEGIEALLLLDIENVGDAHTAPTGKVEVIGADDEVLALISMDGQNILPGNVRRTAVPWVPPAGLDETSVGVVLRTDDGQELRAVADLGSIARDVADEREQQDLPAGTTPGASFGGLPELVGRALWPILLAVLLLIVTARQLQVERRRQAEATSKTT